MSLLQKIKFKDTTGAWNWAFILLFLISLLAILIRLHGLGRFSIWYDEGFTINYAFNFVWSLQFLSVDITSDPPLLPFMVHFWYHFGLYLGLTPGTETFDMYLRLLPFSFSVITVPLVYCLALLVIKDKTVALLGAFLCAISPYHLFYAQELKPYSLYTVLILGAAIYHLKALKSDKTIHWLMFSLLISLGLYSHFIAAWNILLFNFHVIAIQVLDKKIRWKWVYSQILAGIVCLPVILMAARISTIYENATTIYSIRPDFKQPFLTFKTFFAGYGASMGFYHLIFIVSLVLFVAGLFLLRKNKRLVLFFLYYGCLPIFGNVLFWQIRTLPIYEHRLFIVCSIYCFILIGFTINMLPRYAKYAIGAIYIILAPIFLIDYYNQNLHPLETHRMGVRYKVDNRSAAAFIAENIQDNEIVVHATHFTYYPFIYYLINNPVHQCNIYVDHGELEGTLGSYPNVNLWNTYGALPVQIADATYNYSGIWFVISWWEPHETPPHIVNMQHWLSENYMELGTYEFDGIKIMNFSADVDDQ